MLQTIGPLWSMKAASAKCSEHPVVEKKEEIVECGGPPPHRGPKGALLVYNVAKKANIGNIVRSAVAFNLYEIVVVGQKKNINTFGNKGTTAYMRFSYRDTLKEAVAYLRVPAPPPHAHHGVHGLIGHAHAY